MRLIDADKIDKYLEVDLSTGDERVTISWVKSWLGSQSTVYDIDKVVKQLEIEKFDVKSRVHKNGGKAFFEGTMRGLNKAIEIVKEGAK